MPQFAPNEEKVAIATFPVKPAGLACTAELWLSHDGGATKDATSGKIPFISTGADQSISLPMTMPANGGLPYKVLIDPEIEGVAMPGYVADEDVIISALPEVPALISLELLTPACYAGSVVTSAVYYIPANSGNVQIAIAIPWDNLPSDASSPATKPPLKINYATLGPGQYEVTSDFRLRYDAYSGGYSGYKFLPAGSYPLWLMVAGELVEQIGTLVITSTGSGHFSYSITCYDQGLVPGYSTLRYKGMTCTVTNNGSDTETHLIRTYSWYKQDTAYYPSAFQKPGADKIDEREITLGPGQSTTFELSKKTTFNPVGINISKGFFVIDECCGKSADCYVAC